MPDFAENVNGDKHSIFPLPYVPVHSKEAHLSRVRCSRRNVRRHYRDIRMIILVNISIYALNHMYAPAAADRQLLSYMSSVDELLLRAHSTNQSLCATMSTCLCDRVLFHYYVRLFQARNVITDYVSCSSAQARVLDRIWSAVYEFYYNNIDCMSSGCQFHLCDSLCNHSSCVREMSTNILSTLTTIVTNRTVPSSYKHIQSDPITLQHSSANMDSMPAVDTTFTYGCKAKMMPLVADRLSLPADKLHTIDMLSHLPANIASVYRQPQLLLLSDERRIMRSLRDNSSLLSARQVRERMRAYAGVKMEERDQYLRTINRLASVDMVSFTCTPLAVNSVFAVAKDDDSDRLIINAVHGNTYFTDPPNIHLPTPANLCALQMPNDHIFMVAKCDISNYYHHIRIPEYIGNYLCLPGIRAGELGITCIDGSPIDADTIIYPRCNTLPMGWSHAVYVAQCIHEHILYSHGVLSKMDNILNITGAAAIDNRVVHSLYIDDVGLITCTPRTDVISARARMNVLFDALLSCYRRVGLVVKASKVVAPTTDSITLLGVTLAGSSIRLPYEKVRILIANTCAVLNMSATDTITGTTLSTLIGSWCWLMLLNRASLSLLRHTYKFIAISGERPFHIWTCVKRELSSLVACAPLIYTECASAFHSRILASDASNAGAGVVSCISSDDMIARMWPVHYQQAQAVTAEANNWCIPHMAVTRTRNRTACLYKPPYYMHQPALHALPALHNPPSFARILARQQWATIINHRWIYANEHINVLEARSLLSALKWCSSYARTIHTRIFTLVDNSVLYYGIRKGRSSGSYSLVRVMRSCAAMILAHAWHMIPVWIPSQWNPADKPSRIFKY